MKAMSKIIITIVGQDRVGIVAKTCNYLADHKMNIWRLVWEKVKM